MLWRCFPKIIDWWGRPLTVDLRTSVSPGYLPALADSLRNGTLNDAQRETAQALRGAVLALVESWWPGDRTTDTLTALTALNSGPFSAISEFSGSAVRRHTPNESGGGRPQFADRPLSFSIGVNEQFCIIADALPNLSKTYPQKFQVSQTG
jgi:hypothetical protein